jgi:hypothetical protein
MAKEERGMADDAAGGSPESAARGHRGEAGASERPARVARLRAPAEEGSERNAAFLARLQKFERALRAMDAREGAEGEFGAEMVAGRGGSPLAGRAPWERGGSAWCVLTERRREPKTSSVARWLAECEASETNPSRRVADGLFWINKTLGDRLDRWGGVPWGTGDDFIEAAEALSTGMGDFHGAPGPSVGRLSERGPEEAAKKANALEAWADGNLRKWGAGFDWALRGWAGRPLHARRHSQKSLWPADAAEQRAALEELMRWVALWAPPEEGEDSLWESLARRAAAREDACLALRGVAVLARFAAAETTAMWLIAAEEGDEALAIEQAERLFFDAGGFARAIRSKSLAAALAEQGWSKEPWSRDAFEAFCDDGAPWWPRPRQWSDERKAAAWRVMQARGGAWAKIWREMCERRWNGFRGHGEQDVSLPKEVLDSLFSVCAWQWLEAVPALPRPRRRLDAWDPEGAASGQLSAGAAFWRCVAEPPQTGLDETLGQLSRIYGWDAPAEPGDMPFGREPLDDRGKPLDDWVVALREKWSRRVDPEHGPGGGQRGRSLTPCEGLRRAWGRVGQWLAEDSEQGWRAWCALGGPAMGEAFARESVASCERLWRAEIARPLSINLTEREGWPALRGDAAFGLPTRLSEWLALNGLSGMAIEEISRGAAPIREDWMRAMERWSLLSKEGSVCREEMACLRAARDAIELSFSVGGEAHEGRAGSGARRI